MEDNLRLIVLDNCYELGLQINEYLNKKRGTNINYIVPIEEVRFNNGEGKLTIKESIREKDIYIISDVGNYSCTYDMFGFTNHKSPDDHFQDIKRVFYAVRGHSSSVSVLTPLLYESRQHRRKSRESLDCAIGLQDLVELGAKNIITIDAHDVGIHNAIPKSCFENFFCTNYIISDFIDNEPIDFRNMIVVSPDTGAVDRARVYADILRTNVGMFYKRRDLTKVVNGKNPIIEHKYIGDDVSGKNILIVDDMIASGESVIDVAKDLKKLGANNVYVTATFALFTSGIDKIKQAYLDGYINRVYTTNMTYMKEEYKSEEWLKIVNCSELLADIIDTLNKRQSLSPILNGKEKILKKVKPYLKKDNQ
ncbi:MAG: ribose-phosphate diphosphokinase [Bacilli bacterium]